MKLLRNRFTLATIAVITIAAAVTYGSTEAAFGQAGTGGTGGTGPIPTEAPSPEPATATPEAATATAEPTEVVTVIPPTATASPEPTVEPTAVPTAIPTPTSEDLWAAMIADLLSDAAAQFREDMRVAIYEDSALLFEAYASTHFGQLTEFDQRIMDLQEKLDNLDNLIGVSRDVSYNTTQISAAVNARLVELSSEITNLQLAIAGLKQIPTPGPASTVTAGGVVISNCNQCTVGQ